jgi:hypothetical protein
VGFVALVQKLKFILRLILLDGGTASAMEVSCEYIE